MDKTMQKGIVNMEKKSTTLPKITIDVYRSEFFNGPMFHLLINDKLEQAFTSMSDLEDRLNALISNEIKGVL